MSFKSGFESRERESRSLTQQVAVSSCAVICWPPIVIFAIQPLPIYAVGNFCAYTFGHTTVRDRLSDRGRQRSGYTEKKTAV